MDKATMYKVTPLTAADAAIMRDKGVSMATRFADIQDADRACNTGRMLSRLRVSWSRYVRAYLRAH